MVPGVVREAILADLRERLEAMSDDYFEFVGDPAELSERMARLVPHAPSDYSEQIGPVYSTRHLTARWGISRAAVSERVRKGRLLAIKVKDRGPHVYPAFQFRGDEVRPDVIELARRLRRVAGPFKVARWMCAPLPGQDGRTPIDLLDAGEHEAVKIEADRALLRWSS